MLRMLHQVRKPCKMTVASQQNMTWFRERPVRSLSLKHVETFKYALSIYHKYINAQKLRLNFPVLSGVLAPQP